MTIGVPDWEQIALIANNHSQTDFNYSVVVERSVGSQMIDEIDLTQILSDDIGADFTTIEIASVIILNKTNHHNNSTALMIGDWISSLGVAYFEGMTKIVIPPNTLQILGSKNKDGLVTATKFTKNILKIHNSHGAVNFYQIAILGKLKEKQ